MCEDIYIFNTSKCVSDFNRQSNMFLSILSMLTLMSEMCCSISTVQYNVLWQPGASYAWRLYAGALQCMKNSCTQGVVIPLNHTLCTSPTFG